MFTYDLDIVFYYAIALTQNMTKSLEAVVKRQFGEIIREGRGFSLQELKKAGIDSSQAYRIGLPVDVLRKSAHQENIDKLADSAKRINAEREAERKVSKPKTEEVKVTETKAEGKKKPKAKKSKIVKKKKKVKKK